MRSQYTVLSLCVLRFYSLSTDRREFRALTPPGGTGTGYSDVKPGSGRDRGGHSVLAQRPCWMHHVHKSMQLFGTSVLCLSAWCYWIAAPFSGNALRQAGMRSTKRHGPPQRFRPCRLLGAHSGGNHAFWGPPRNPRPRCLSRSRSSVLRKLLLVAAGMSLSSWSMRELILPCSGTTYSVRIRASVPAL